MQNCLGWYFDVLCFVQCNVMVLGVYIIDIYVGIDWIGCYDVCFVIVLDMVDVQLCFDCMLFECVGVDFGKFVLEIVVVFDGECVCLWIE